MEEDKVVNEETAENADADMTDAEAGGPDDAGSAAGGEERAVAEESEDEEALCRYCFENSDDGELISPCKCLGGQKFVHLKCLRRWQVIETSYQGV